MYAIRSYYGPFDGDKNIYQNGLIHAFQRLNTQGIQVVVTTITDEIKDPTTRKEIEEKYTIARLDDSNRLLGEF